MNWPAPGSLPRRLCALALVQLVLLAGAVFLVGCLLRDMLRAGAAELPVPDFDRAASAMQSLWAALATLLASGALIVGGGVVLTWRWIALPLGELSRAARSLGAGDPRLRALLARPGEPGEVRELAELGRGLHDIARRIERLGLTQKELLANVSHELRTPLARMRVAVDIAREADAAAARDSIEEIAVDLGELERLVEDILTATRMDLQSAAQETTGLPIRRTDVAPGSIAQHAGERFRARHPGRALDVSVADALPAIPVDAMLFQRVIDNLLDNAHRYSPEDTPIRLGVTNGGGAVVFEVVDRGMGTPERDLERVFEPFFRAERSRSRGTGGIGLGLTLAKRIVDAHGGRIELHSGSGVGTRARVSITPSG